jgi:hypothetical protein
MARTPPVRGLDDDESAHDPHPPQGRLTDVEQLRLVEDIRRLGWGGGPDQMILPELFDAIMGAFTTCGCELVVLRMNADRQVEVLLFERPPSDKFYAGEWHSPGSIFRGTETMESVFDRLVERELAGAQISSPVRIWGNYFRTPRGPEVTLLHVAWLEGEYTGKKGRWFPLDQPPDKTIEHHLVLLGQVRRWLEGIKIATRS